MGKNLLRALAALLAAVLLASLCACGQAAAPSGAAQTPPPAPSPTTAPTATPVPSVWTLTDESPEEILALAELPGLTAVDAAACRAYDALLQLQQLRPDCDVRWVYDYHGQSIPSDAESLTVSDPEGLEDALRCLPAVKTVDLTACTPSLEQMERLYDSFPEVEFLWMVPFCEWTVRSDITCFSSLRTIDPGCPRYTSEEYAPLFRFCRHLRALDLGHNKLTDLSLIGTLTELQVLIVVDNPLTDISPLANLTQLMYLEIFMCRKIEDFSCLNEMHEMRDLNMSYCVRLKDVSFIDNMPYLENAWFRNTRVGPSDIAPYTGRDPKITFIIGSPEDINSTCCGWRDKERNRAIRKAFANWPDVVEYRYWNDVAFSEAFNAEA